MSNKNNRKSDKRTPGKGLVFGGGLEDLFKASDVDNEEILEVDINLLSPFPNHKFKPLSHDELNDMAESMKIAGVIEKIVVLPMENDKYTILSGHNRHAAAKLAGLKTVPITIRDVPIDVAEYIVNAANTNRRGELTRKERAYAISSEYEMLKKQGFRSDLVKQIELIESMDSEMAKKLQSVDTNATAAQAVATFHNLTPDKVLQEVRIAKLGIGLMQQYDNYKLTPTVAALLFTLSEDEQNSLSELLNEDYTVSVIQAKTIRKLSKDRNGKMSKEELENILTNVTDKKNKNKKSFLVLKEKIDKILPNEILNQDLEQADYEKIIFEAISFWSQAFKKRKVRFEKSTSMDLSIEVATNLQ